MNLFSEPADCNGFYSKCSLGKEKTLKANLYKKVASCQRQSDVLEHLRQKHGYKKTFSRSY